MSGGDATNGQLQYDNQVEFTAHIGRSPHVRSVFSDTIGWLISGVYDNTFNGVVYARLTEASADEAIVATLDEFQKTMVPVPPDWFRDGRKAPETDRVPAQWFVTGTCTPGDLGARLEAHGCEPMRNAIGMVADLATLDEAAARPVPGLEIVAVRDAAALHRWCEVSEKDPVQQRIREAIYLSLGLDDDRPLQHYLALLGGEPAGGSSIFLGSESAGLYHVGVEPHARRRGIGTRLTLAPMLHAREKGYRVGVMAPSPESQRMYGRLGFRVYPCPEGAYFIP